jgi:hypothetical protein
MSQSQEQLCVRIEPGEPPTVVVSFGNQTLHSDRFDLNSAQARGTFLVALKQKVPALSPEQLQKVDAKLIEQGQQPKSTKPQVQDSQDLEELALPESRWPKLNPKALHGVVGEVVRSLEPHTEADPVAIVIQLLTACGNAIGRTAYFQVESDRHFANLFTCIVGQSARGGKGTSWGRVRALMRLVDAEWSKKRLSGGLSSGEGLIQQVRDPVTKPGKEGAIVVVDAGESDNRLGGYRRGGCWGIGQ